LRLRKARADTMTTMITTTAAMATYAAIDIPPAGGGAELGEGEAEAIAEGVEMGEDVVGVEGVDTAADDGADVAGVEVATAAAACGPTRRLVSELDL